MVTTTETAQKRIVELLKEKKDVPQAVRVYLQDGTSAITDSEGKSLFYTGDTGPGLSPVWQKVSPQIIIADVSFPNKLGDIAKEAGRPGERRPDVDIGRFRADRPSRR